ncbi:aminodeoxychorismate lyase [Rhodanobacter sp. MP7CTX1]|jgi:4-amino-4-deoxychorismate lyase|uniref:aminodeoxychorismate lyase n=1 Tax=Rhodanobacter sp. MP7CTX1 TaxID=2723084 RepID=UPI001617558B|nr:aminodeoxychorismate lyase [Rhodanobacter sp. MP7CTX1]MBB6186813.1 4-amino-4-deoxychorismate lyase [Rhodanobacter sp. MP7CTX1]
MAVRTLINGAPIEVVPALDRGLAYGDGLFESIRFVGAVAPLWSRHMQRLALSCERLRLPVPDPAQLWREALDVSRGMTQSVVRITLTRGIGERGYALPLLPQPTRIVAAFAPPQLSEEVYSNGVRVRLCDIRLAEQPLLAGMKHLNRLEQVLARAEWNDPAIAEGLLCDSHDRVISATMANLFALVDGVLLTPAVDRCGVAGVARAEVLATCPLAQVDTLTLDAVLEASEVFLSSSVRGILPVHSLGERVYATGAVTRQLQQHWHNLGFSMEQGG